MQSGFNTNVRHRGVVFHVQTEDSGLAHPHVITHLYHHGTIVASVKREYADRVDAPDLARELKGLMEAQHAAMLGRLRRGDFDDLVRERLGAGVFGEEAPAAEASSSDAPAHAAPAAAGTDERPLDEMILDYLVESARKRKRRVQ